MSKKSSKTTPPEHEPKADRPSRQFRAIKDNSDKLMVQSSLDGGTWINAISGLDAADVQKMLKHLADNGKKIVNTPHFKYKP